jgi:hypothetical protein
MPDDPVSPTAGLARAVWDNAVIHRRICELATKGVCAVIARLDQRSFEVAIPFVWRDWTRDECCDLLDEALEEVTNPVRASLGPGGPE